MSGAEFGGVDIDLLADYIGGALEGTPEESAVAARVVDDPDWRAAFASLSGGMAAVTASLGALGAETMPAELAARLEAAFSGGADSGGAGDTPLGGSSVDVNLGDHAETGLSHARGHLVSVGGSNPVLSAAKAPRSRRRRWVAPIAVAAGLVAFVGFGADYLAGRPSQDQATSSSAGAGHAEDQAAPLSSGQTLLSSGNDYTLSTLAEPPMQAMTAPGLTHRATPDLVSGESVLSRLTQSAALNACLEAIEAENAAGKITVESVDYARFAGSPALVVRFSASNGHWAWASGPACGTPSGGAAKLAGVPVG